MTTQNNNNNNNLIDGKQFAQDIRAELKATIASHADQYTPGLAVILVGSRRDSQTYVNMKKKACAAAGILSKGFDFDEDVSQETLLQCIQQCNHDPTIHGILVQLPLPRHLNEQVILNSVHPDKDVDGLHPSNVAQLQLYKKHFAQAPFSIPCTPLGCMELLERSKVPIAGQRAVVIGRSQLVGLPMAKLLLNADATVTVVHSKTPHPEKIVQQADIVVAAVGKAQLVKNDWLKDGCVVIDVGINSVDIVPTKEGGKPYKLVGDVDFDDCVSKCSNITPVPGGVGPMTIAMLLRNTLRSCQRAHANAIGVEEEKKSP